MRDCQGPGRAEIKTDLEEMKVTESRFVAANPEDRSRDRLLVLRSRGRQKRRSSRQKLAAVRGRLTRRAVPALHKGRIRRGSGNDIGGRNKKQELRLGSTEAFYVALGQTLGLMSRSEQSGFPSG
jgi:hypothetical protein